MIYENATIEIIEVEDNIIMLSLEEGSGNSGDLGWGDL